MFALFALIYKKVLSLHMIWMKNKAQFFKLFSICSICTELIFPFFYFELIYSETNLIPDIEN